MITHNPQSVHQTWFHHDLVVARVSCFRVSGCLHRLLNYAASMQSVCIPSLLPPLSPSSSPSPCPCCLSPPMADFESGLESWQVSIGVFTSQDGWLGVRIGYACCCSFMLQEYAAATMWMWCICCPCVAGLCCPYVCEWFEWSCGRLNTFWHSLEDSSYTHSLLQKLQTHTPHTAAYLGSYSGLQLSEGCTELHSAIFHNMITAQRHLLICTHPLRNNLVTAQTHPHNCTQQDYGGLRYMEGMEYAHWLISSEGTVIVIVSCFPLCTHCSKTRPVWLWGKNSVWQDCFARLCASIVCQDCVDTQSFDNPGTQSWHTNLAHNPVTNPVTGLCHRMKVVRLKLLETLLR